MAVRVAECVLLTLQPDACAAREKRAFHFAKSGAIQGHEDLGICTPYAAQAKIIGKLLEGEALRDRVQVGTVHSYQGDERSTMLLDIPESQAAPGTSVNLSRVFRPSTSGRAL